MLGYFASLLMGIALGLTGGGGSILTVPIFVYLFGLSASLSTTYSLFVVGSCALVGGILQRRKQRIPLKPVLIFAIPSMVGVSLSRQGILPLVPDPLNLFQDRTLSRDSLILIAFALLMILASLAMIRKPAYEVPSSEKNENSNVFLMMILGLGVGLVAGFVGAGGGFLIVPALVMLGRIPMKVAVGTSLLVIALQSLSGFVGDWLRQVKIDWNFLLVILSLSLFGIFLGTSLSARVSEEKLKRLFGWLVLLMGMAMGIEQLIKIAISNS